MSGFLNRIQRSIAGHEKSDGDGPGVIANLGHTIASALPRLSHPDSGRGNVEEMSLYASLLQAIFHALLLVWVHGRNYCLIEDLVVCYVLIQLPVSVG
jgi:hypothetical protein